MKDSTGVLTVSVLMMLCLIVGCSERVDYTVQNSGKETVNEVGVFINEHSFKHGILIPNTHSGFGGAFKVEHDNLVKIVWEDSNAEKHSVELTVSGEDLRDPRSIMFVIGDDMQVTTEWRFER